MSKAKRRRAREATPHEVHFTVSDLLQSFGCLVVSGGGFSEENSESFFRDAAVALAVDRAQVANFNLGDMSQLSPQQLDGLDRALFGYTGFARYVAQRLARGQG